jgi:2-polyprenyl-6-methoxyphenol hydroxylase-like FAD-dependent oxidoreductase
VIGLNQATVDLLAGPIKMKRFTDANLARASDCAVDFVMADHTARPLLEAKQAMAVSLRDDESGRTSLRSGLVDRCALRFGLADGVNVQWGKKYTHYVEDEKGITAHFDDGSTVSGDVLIAGDGARSLVREQWCPALKPVGLGLYILAGSCDMPDEAHRGPVARIAKHALVRMCGKLGVSCMSFSYVEQSTGKCNLLWSISMPLALATSHQIAGASDAYARMRLLALLQSCSNDDMISIVRSTLQWYSVRRASCACALCSR